MPCNSFLLKEDICRPRTFTKKQTMPFLEATMLNDFILKENIQKNDKELYKLLSQCNINYVCYYEYAKFIYNRYKNGYFTFLCKEEPAIESIIDLLYWSFGDPATFY
ncbi:hypothetical protein CLRAG_33450 [Clostridium ragsdalei P11]|uniref:Uncharacterized protein n=1 Tax=Clostridium ragsdalei P11 TaxID=1353534 RepID=A0A1A6AKT7_9CLOT|nr:hypothetical protein [Clostridium ragsdalei]OBR90697.1 hypothetical protein CLRAG_33450 [Clostridium ragsdalei P11]